MNRFTSTLQQWLVRIGLMGVTGIALLAFSLAIYFSAIAPAQTRIAALQQEARTRLEQARKPARTTVADQDSPVAQLAVFYRYFPDHHSAPDWLERIYAAAREQNLQLEQGEYHTIRGNSGKLTRLQVTLPLKGSYLQIRKFLAAILSEVSIASLDSVKFERQKIGESTIDARIKLTLYLE